MPLYKSKAIAVVYPSYMKGRGVEIAELREAYVLDKLKNYLVKREAALVTRVAKRKNANPTL